MKKMLTVLSVLGFALGMTACSSGPDCASVCDKQGGCPDATAEATANCKTMCDEYQKCADATSCGSEFDDVLSCENDNACSTSTTSPCATQQTAIGTCIEKDIAANPTHGTSCNF